MPTPRSYQTEAVVIKKTKLGEADSILTFYTPRLGKIQGFARSLRKPKSKLAGHLELLTHSQVSLTRGKNLDTITGSQAINSFLPLKNDLWLTSCALYVTELVNQFTAEHIENPPLFRLLLAVLEELCRENDRELALRFFELHLLDSTGYRPQLRECVVCHRELQPEVNAFSPAGGGMLCPACAPRQPAAVPVSVNAQKVLRLFQGSDISAVSRLKVNRPLSAELDKVLGGYLKYLLEKEIKSAAWLTALREERLKAGPDALP